VAFLLILVLPGAAAAEYTIRMAGCVETIEIPFQPSTPIETPTAYGFDAGAPAWVTVRIDDTVPGSGVLPNAVLAIEIEIAGQTWFMDAVAPTTTQLSVIDNDVLPSANNAAAVNFGVGGPPFGGTFDDYTFIAFTLSSGPNGLQSAMMPTAQEMLGLLGTFGPNNAFGIDTSELRFARPDPGDPGGLPLTEVINIRLQYGTVVSGVPSLGPLGVFAMVGMLLAAGGAAATRQRS